MMSPEKLSLSEFVSRRLHPVKVTLSLLGHEMKQNTDKGVTRLNSSLLGSIVQTVQLFVEDYEKLIEKSAPGRGGGGERRFVGEETE
jgi:hypothetical protein